MSVLESETVAYHPQGLSRALRHPTFRPARRVELHPAVRPIHSLVIPPMPLIVHAVETLPETPAGRRRHGRVDGGDLMTAQRAGIPTLVASAASGKPPSESGFPAPSKMSVSTFPM